MSDTTVTSYIMIFVGMAFGLWAGPAYMKIKLSLGLRLILNPILMWALGIVVGYLLFDRSIWSAINFGGVVGAIAALSSALLFLINWLAQRKKER